MSDDELMYLYNEFWHLRQYLTELHLIELQEGDEKMKNNDLNHSGICWAIEYIQTYIVYLAKEQKISDEEVSHLFNAWNELHEVLKSQNEKW